VLHHNFCIYHGDALRHEIDVLFHLLVVTIITKFKERDGHWQHPKNVAMYHGLKVNVVQ